MNNPASPMPAQLPAHTAGRVFVKPYGQDRNGCSLWEWSFTHKGAPLSGSADSRSAALRAACEKQVALGCAGPDSSEILGYLLREIDWAGSEAVEQQGYFALASAPSLLAQNQALREALAGLLALLDGPEMHDPSAGPSVILNGVAAARTVATAALASLAADGGQE